MICIRTDPTGSLARIQCDHCRRVSSLFLFSKRKRMRDPVIVRQWLRYRALGMGWGTMAVAECGQETRIDLCRRCRLAALNTPK